MKKLVKSIRVMGYDYKIYLVPTNSKDLFQPGDTVAASAIVDHTTQEIFIDRSVKGLARFSDCIHEVIHVIFEHSGVANQLEDAGVDDEEIVLAIENGLLQFVIDNDIYKLNNTLQKSK